jgi:hypothetical protein
MTRCWRRPRHWRAVAGNRRRGGPAAQHGAAGGRPGSVLPRPAARTAANGGGGLCLVTLDRDFVPLLPARLQARPSRHRTSLYFFCRGAPPSLALEPCTASLNTPRPGRRARLPRAAMQRMGLFRSVDCRRNWRSVHLVMSTNRKRTAWPSRLCECRMRPQALAAPAVAVVPSASPPQGCFANPQVPRNIVRKATCPQLPKPQSTRSQAARASATNKGAISSRCLARISAVSASTQAQQRIRRRSPSVRLPTPEGGMLCSAEITTSPTPHRARSCWPMNWSTPCSREALQPRHTLRIAPMAIFFATAAALR